MASVCTGDYFKLMTESNRKLIKSNEDIEAANKRIAELEYRLDMAIKRLDEYEGK